MKTTIEITIHPGEEQELAELLTRLAQHIAAGHCLSAILDQSGNQVGTINQKGIKPMKPELMKNWFVVQNGQQIDIHVIDHAERREITVVADVRDEKCASLIANAPKYKEALEQIIDSMKLADGEAPNSTHARRMFDLAYAALGLQVVCEATEKGIK